MTILSTKRTATFAQTTQVAEGWTWALASDELKRGQVKGLRMLGRDLVLWRGEDGGVRAADAHCPHMGAHLKEGKVEGNSIRCFFHNWKFGQDGQLSEVPCLNKTPDAGLTMWPTTESLGLIWVWPGETPTRPAPFVPELEGQDCQVRVLPKFTEQCHPNVVLINAIDEHHFNSVHSLPVDIYMETNVRDGTTIQFANVTPPRETHPVGRLLQPLYSGPLTYSMCYHSGNTGSVTVGPDKVHFHILFALRLTDEGTTEGRRVLVTRKRSGIRGRALNKVLLGLTNIVGNYFADGDSQVFESIRFDFALPTRADHAIIDFVRHIEAQPAVRVGDWSRP